MRWKKEPRETGLRSVLAGERSSWLRDDKGVRYACVSALCGGGWYFVAGWDSGIPRENTCQQPVETEAEAKTAAMAYVKKHLPPKLTDRQRRVLENLAAGRRADSHCVGRSEFGGLTATMASLHRAGLVDRNGITDAGRAALAAQVPHQDKGGE
ncbi:hypothetical protein ACXIUT_27855 [Achromobacter denitrificans]